MAYSYYPQQFFQGYQQPMQMQSQPAQSQIQSGGFIPVPSEEVARNYPVAPGNSITFKNENAPYVYTKTMGFSQLDRPMFEKYKLVKEEDPAVEPQISAKLEPSTNKLDDKTAEELKEQIELLWSEINAIKKKPKKNSDGGDD